MSIRADGTIGPDLIVIGAMKAGTTTLHRLLAAHPEIGVSRDKETDFFVAEKAFSRGPAWYAGQFEGGYRWHAESSPNYTKVDDFSGVPARVAAYSPDVRLVFVARDPVDRAVSQYRHSWTIGDIAMGPADLPGTDEWRHIVDTSRYARQLDAWLEHFPAERLLVLDFDELTDDPERAMGRVWEHLGARPVAIEAARHNDQRDLSRIPAPVLRLAQSRLGRAATRVVGRAGRDRLRGLLARGPVRDPGPFPNTVRERLREALTDDAARFRAMTGMAFERWSV